MRGVRRLLHLPHSRLLSGKLPSFVELESNEYLARAEKVLTRIQHDLEKEEQHFEREDIDIIPSAGVVTIKSGTVGTWVVNQHQASKQIWLSSPISGPWRFSLTSADQLWVDHLKGERRLQVLLEEEFTKLLHLTERFSFSDKF